MPKPEPKRKPAKKLGRPRENLTEGMKARICRELSLGKGLRGVLKQKGMPSMNKVMTVLHEDAAFQKLYTRARERCIQVHIDGLIDLADSATPENAHAVRIKVDVRKWIASKLLPRLYGDRVELSGGLQVGVEVDDFTQRERLRRVAFLLNEGVERQPQAQQAQAQPRLGLPAPAPDPVYRDAVPSGAVRAQHPGNTPDESREERVINPYVRPPGHFNTEEQGWEDLVASERGRRRRDEA